MSTTDPLSVTFAALADPTRRALLGRLRAGTATVTELAQPFSLGLPAVSKQIAVLERAGLIIKSRQAQRRPCVLDPTPLMAAGEFLDLYRRHWEGNLDNLAGYLHHLQEGTDS